MPDTLSLAFVDGRDAPLHVVTAANFGVNLLFDRDAAPEDQGGSSVCENYAQAVDVMSATSFRYPGGTIAEALFDLRNPENPDQDGTWQEAVYRAFDPDGAGPADGVTLTLSGALDFAQDSGMTMTFVMPTYCFLGTAEDAAGHRDAAVNVELVQGFVLRLLDEAAARGTVVAAIEIGNEWYGDYTEIFGTRMTPVEYGRVASSLSAVIQQAIDQWQVTRDVPAGWQEPDIAIQVGQGGNGAIFRADGHFLGTGYVGPTTTATELIFREFDTAAERAAIDGLISHRYLSGPIANATGWSYSPFDRFDALAAEAGGFGELDRYVTEWNVSNRNETVLSQWHACAMVTLFSEMMAAGVDHANVWALQQNNQSRLTNNAGFNGERFAGLTPAGEVWRLMAEALPGMGYLRTTDNLEGLQTHAYAAEDRMVTYACNVSADSQTFVLDAAALLPGYSFFWVTVVGAAEPGSTVSAVRIMAGRDLLVDGQFTLTLAAGEVAQVELVVGRGVEIVGHDGRDAIGGSADDDTLRGSDGRDNVSGDDGADHLFGDAGRDQLRGGNGADTLDGNSGEDALFGGRGADAMVGGRSADLLAGGLGADVLRGGEGADTLLGGEGNDDLFGGSGADLFVFEAAGGVDRVRDLGSADRIDVGAWGATVEAFLERVRVTALDGDVILRADDGTQLVVENAGLGAVMDSLLF